MTTDSEVGAQFRDRFAIEPIGDDAVLVDLTTGGFFRLNPTATKVCMALQQTSSLAAAASRLAASMALPPAEAAALLQSVRLQLAEPGVRTEPVGPFRYRRHEGGYALEDNGRVVLTIDQSGRTLPSKCAPKRSRSRCWTMSAQSRRSWSTSAASPCCTRLRACCPKG